MLYKFKTKAKALLILSLLIFITSCTNELNGCYNIGMINLAIDSPQMESVFYKISDKNIIEQIAGDLIVSNYFESKIEKAFILNKGDTIDRISNAKIKKTTNGIFLIIRSSRFIGIGDSLKVSNRIKKETLLLLLNDNKIIRLNICN